MSNCYSRTKGGHEMVGGRCVHCGVTSVAAAILGCNWHHVACECRRRQQKEAWDRLQARVAQLEQALRDLVGVLLRTGQDDSPAVGPLIQKARAALDGEKGKGV